MRKFVLPALVAAIVRLPDAAYAADVDDAVYDAPGTGAELAGRARLCAIKLLKNGQVQLDDATTKNLIGASALKGAAIEAASSVVTMADIEAGTIIVQYRFPFRWALVSQVGEATTTILTKDGRFKLETSGMRSAQLNSGYSSNPGFSDLHEKSPVVKNYTKALENEQSKLVACVQTPTSNDW